MSVSSVRTEVGRGWRMYLGDCVEVLQKEIADELIDYSIFSPPFASLYTYSASPYDMGNCRTREEFFQHFDYLTRELYRVFKPGRNLSFHCMNLPLSKERDGVIGLVDFRGELIRAFEKSGFVLVLIYLTHILLFCCIGIAVTGLVRVVVFSQKSKAVRFDVVGKTRPTIPSSPSPAKRVSILDQHSDANMPSVLHYVPSLGRAQSRSDWYVDRHRVVIWVNNDGFFRDHVISKGREISKGEVQQLDPRFISAIVSGTVPYISEINVDMRVGILKQIFNWIVGWTSGELSAVGHSHLIDHRSPLKQCYANINRIDNYEPFSERYHSSLHGLIVGIMLFGVGFFLSIPVCDSLCEGRIGLLQIGGMALCFCLFWISQVLLIWNLSWLVR